MSTYKMNGRFLGLFSVVLTMFFLVGMEVDSKCIDQVQSDTRECEHVWKRLDLPDCMQVSAEYEFADHDLNDLCKYQIALKNDCSKSYVFEFECKDVKLCPKGPVLEPGESGNVVFGFDNYGKNEVSEKEIVMLFGLVGGQGEDGGVVADEAKAAAGVFTGSSSGEVVWGIGSCQEEIGDDGCQVTSLRRPMGRFDDVLMMLLALVGILWRRRRVV